MEKTKHCNTAGWQNYFCETWKYLCQNICKPNCKSAITTNTSDYEVEDNEDSLSLSQANENVGSNSSNNFFQSPSNEIHKEFKDDHIFL